ncbi:MAG: metallophosphoesterase [bacterium]
MAKVSKIIWWGVFFVGLGFLGYSYFIEPNIIEVENQVFDLNCLSQNINNEKIVQISDLHFTDKTPQARAERIFQEIEKIQPAYIFITGDLVSNKGGKELMVGFTKQLSAIAKTYIIFGNWDYDAFGTGIVKFQKELENAGAVVLTDEFGQVDFQGKCKILLAHNPDIVKQDLVGEFDLVLAGHTHGGQVYLPFITKEIVLRFVGGKDYPKGRFQTGWRSWLYVNRGLGVSSFPFRFLSPPEITIIILK